MLRENRLDMYHTTTLLLLLSTSFLAFAPSARCVVQTPAGAFHQAKVVFVGKVFFLDDPGLPPAGEKDVVFDLTRRVKVKLAVEHVYRGKKTDEIEIATRMGGLEWGYEFKVGEKYLVYAQTDKTNENEFVVEGCGRTRSLAEAKEDLKFLETQRDKDGP